MKRIPRWWISLPLTAFAVLLLVLSSCTPAWFPDSNSFVSVGPSGESFLHNIKDKTSVKITGTGKAVGQIGAAVAPDGKSFALCKIVGTGGIEISLFDSKGKEILVSTHPLKADATTKSDSGPALFDVYWSPDSKRLVGFISGAKVAFSWLRETKELTSYADTLPISHLLAGEASWLHRHYPCLPDNSGFLSLHKGEPVIQGWKADTVTKISVAESAKGFDFQKITSKEGEFGAWLSPHWRGKLLVSQLGGQELVVDTGMNEFRIEKSKDAEVANKFGAENKVVVIHRFRNGAMLAVDGDKPNIIYFGAMHDEKKVLEPVKKDGGAMFNLNPSPDNQRMIVTLFSDPFRTKVFNQNGEIELDFAGYTKVK